MTADSPDGAFREELPERLVELVRATYRVMARQGSHRLSLQDIADDAGVSKGLLLYHFRSKDALLVATMRHVLHQTAERIRRNVVDAGDARQALSRLLDAVWVAPGPNRDFQLFYYDLIEHAYRNDTYAQLPDLLREIINSVYAEVIARGVEEGIFAVDDPDQAAVSMRAVIEGAFLQWLQDPTPESTHASYRARCEADLLRVLGARGRDELAISG